MPRRGAYRALAFHSKTAGEALAEGLKYAGFLEPRPLEHGGAAVDATTKAVAASKASALLDIRQWVGRSVRRLLILHQRLWQGQRRTSSCFTR